MYLQLELPIDKCFIDALELQGLWHRSYVLSEEACTVIHELNIPCLIEEAEGIPMK